MASVDRYSVILSDRWVERIYSLDSISRLDNNKISLSYPFFLCLNPTHLYCSVSSTAMTTSTNAIENAVHILIRKKKTPGPIQRRLRSMQKYRLNASNENQFKMVIQII